jgi:hypothetical protein
LSVSPKANTGSHIEVCMLSHYSFRMIMALQPSDRHHQTPILSSYQHFE